jgi:hypothetical protein
MSHFLKRNKKFNKAIIDKTRKETKYCFYKIIDVLTEEIPDEDEDLIADTAINYFWENIYPEAKEQKISFNFKIESYYIIKAIFPDKTTKYVESDIYPGKIIYSSEESALKGIKRLRNFYPDKTIFKIEKKKE